MQRQLEDAEHVRGALVLPDLKSRRRPRACRRCQARATRANNYLSHPKTTVDAIRITVERSVSRVMMVMPSEDQVRSPVI